MAEVKPKEVPRVGPDKFDPRLGRTVVYRVPEQKRTSTLRAGVTQIGSLYHSEMQIFAGVIARVNGDGVIDIVIYPPAKPPVTISNVERGNAPGEFQFVELAKG